MSRFRDGAFLALAAFAVTGAFVVASIHVLPSPPRDRTVGHCLNPVLEGHTPPPDCGPVTIDAPIDRSVRPHDPNR